MTGETRNYVRAKLLDLYTYHDCGKDQERFEQQAGDHAAIGKDSVRCFTGEPRVGACQSRANRGQKLAPRRGPLDQKLRWLDYLDRLFELDRGIQTPCILPFFRIAI